MVRVFYALIVMGISVTLGYKGDLGSAFTLPFLFGIEWHLASIRDKWHTQKQTVVIYRPEKQWEDETEDSKCQSDK